MVSELDWQTVFVSSILTGCLIFLVLCQTKLNLVNDSFAFFAVRFYTVSYFFGRFLFFTSSHNPIS